MVRTLWRRWYVTGVGLLLTAAVVVMLQARTGVYSTQVDVQLIPPAQPGATRSPSPAASLIALAGMVERRVGDDVDREEPVSPKASLSGLGVREGTMVTLPNSGGQWNYFFDDPLLRVQVVALSEADANRRRDQAVQEIVRTLRALQVADGVPVRQRVTTRLVPRLARVTYEGGSPDRAAVVTVLIGIAVTCAATIRVDAFMRRRAHPPRVERYEPATSA
jgi:hypothetical protein